MKKRRTADDFARRVDALYARALAGKPFDAKNQEREVQAVAFALARIRSLIDCAVKQVGLSALPETALVAAADLLDALMKGTSHPIWRYIREGKSRKRANKAPASLIDNMRRAYVVGILRSLQNDAQPPLSRRNAAQKLAECAPAIGVTLTVDQIIGWDKTFSGQAPDAFAPDAFRSDILELARKRVGDPPYSKEQILKIGLGRAYFLWALPDRVGSAG
jgi:hypothetical protein